MAEKPTYEELEQRLKELEKELGRRMRTKEALRQSEETARALLNATSDSAILIDTQGTIIAINEVAVHRLGKIKNKVVRMNLFDMFPPGVAKERKARAAEVVRSGEPAHFEDHIEELVFNNTFYPVFDRKGSVEKLAVYSRDITDQKRAQEALRESEEIFRNLASTAYDAMIMMDSQGNISFWNEAAARIFGYTKKEATGKNLHRLLAPEKYVQDFNERFSQFKATGQGDGIGKTLELSAIRKDGTEFPMELSLSSFQHRRQWNALGIIRDITRRKLAEEEHLQKEKLQSILEMTGAVCHELSQPLQNLILSSDALSAAISEDHPLYKHATEITGQADRIGEITKKLMGITKYETKDYIEGIKIIDIDKSSNKLKGSDL
ncbi:MAG: PAS domain S-box protein [Desulfobacterales bacterium]|uniref:histidine kinase n=1 Tax=Candidatus Desulfatibia vada TaxID=2841696 RepID=A0A8J6TPF3_9BACT|nr:PAS domain S-box protein [Candidatus Desulfatibia vada]MBL6970753.1 PAS domain S-box protein [Desulfobacterales bacterium]